jgi:hypothetical protein
MEPGRAYRDNKNRNGAALVIPKPTEIILSHSKT